MHTWVINMVNIPQHEITFCIDVKLNANIICKIIMKTFHVSCSCSMNTYSLYNNLLQTCLWKVAERFLQQVVMRR